jgi:hypothetical protein
MEPGRHGPRLPNATDLAEPSWYINCGNTAKQRRNADFSSLDGAGP